MPGSSIETGNIRSKDSSPLRLSPRSMPLHQRPARLPPLDKPERKKLPGNKSPRPPPPPPTPAPWSWYHRDCVDPHPNIAPSEQAHVLRARTRVNHEQRQKETIVPRLRVLTGCEAPEQDIPLQVTYYGDRRNQRASASTTMQTLSRTPSEHSSPSAAMLRLQQLASNVHEVTPASTPTASSSPSPTMVRLQHIATNIHETVIDRACWFVPPRRKELAPAAVYNVNLDGQLSLFLLQVAQAVFEEMISLDTLIKRILEFAQRLVNADRASLFLVDNNKNELVSTVFDLKYEPHQENDFQKKEIRMPLNKGIAGYVASHGVTMNITDAYADRRFNKAVDDATGYRTTTILCMPIKVQGQVIAVVQMVNKRNKTVFNSEDEAAFKIFSTLFGLALHHARLYDQIVRNEQKYKIALEVLSYHNTCDEEDVNLLLDERKSSKYETVNYNDFLLNPFEFDDVEKCKGFLTMFDDLFDIRKFDVTVLTRFLLTVKKNYRKVPYHNFDHGWSVANAVYVILKRDEKKRFDYNSKLALFVACLCHDLDHRGYTNRYMFDIGSPLAAMYSTSTLEHHHFNITVNILQQEGHNIFSGLSSEDYKEVLDLIRQCILATDLAAFFPNLAKINKLVLLKRNFNWNDESHRSLCRSIVMTSADLSAAAKPFAVQLQTATIIQAEFFHQGDLEKLAGREPIPMMDRDKPNEQPNSQVKFLTDICLPCYKALYHLFPATRIMYDSVIDNLECWRSRARSMLLDELLSEEEYGARRQLKN